MTQDTGQTRFTLDDADSRDASADAGVSSGTAGESGAESEKKAPSDEKASSSKKATASGKSSSKKTSSGGKKKSPSASGKSLGKASEKDSGKSASEDSGESAPEGKGKSSSKKASAGGKTKSSPASEKDFGKSSEKDSAPGKSASGNSDDGADGGMSEGDTGGTDGRETDGGCIDKEKDGSGEKDGSEEKDTSQDGGSGEPAPGQGTSKSARRRRKRNRNKQRREIVPSATRDELSALDDDALAAKADSLEVDASEYGERDDLVSAVYDALLQAEGFVEVEGILDLVPDGFGFLRTSGYLPGEHDAYVGMNFVRRNALRKGDHVAGRVRPPRDNEKYPALNTITALNGEPFDGPKHRAKFANLTPVYPDERLVMEHGREYITARAIDLVAPIGKGQRGLIVSPPKAGKTTVLKDIAAAISANNPEVHLMCLLVDERPEEVTDMERSIDGEVISSTFDMPSESHIAVSELVIERAKRLVEEGQDVVILLDSITRLARAYNLGQPASGRILSGGVDSQALYPPKKFLGAARNIEFGGSLTILGTALVDTGSKMDEVIFEEFKGTGNMELKLDRQLADKRVYPAIDPVASSTRKDELLVDEQEAPLVWGLRSLLANMNNPERAMKMLIQSLKQTETNREFLVKSARKASKTEM